MMIFIMLLKALLYYYVMIKKYMIGDVCILSTQLFLIINIFFHILVKYVLLWKIVQFDFFIIIKIINFYMKIKKLFFLIEILNFFHINFWKNLT